MSHKIDATSNAYKNQIGHEQQDCQEKEVGSSLWSVNSDR
jgi:hypothetical protein